MSQQKIQYVTVSDSAYLWIKNAILNGTLKAGERLVQEELTEKLGVSRTPVRDAIKRLESEGLLVSRPHYGAFVFQPSKKQLREIYEIRILIEQYCAAKACNVATDKELQSIKSINDKMAKVSPLANEYMQLDFQFHKRIADLSGCSNMTIEILEGLWNKSCSFKSLYFQMEGCTENTISKHYSIVESLIKRDIAGVQKAIADHLNDVVNSVSTSSILL
jgi:DNA-binding GntR family transcriptional regulator